ncbi:hypothetical protein, partial [Staphylococcus aureus]|uniref:hypothetical protein n=1 Tax=Staphylococcus aureus TaxID=1280 RepID=UPI00210A7BEE
MANLFKDLVNLVGTITNLDGDEAMRALILVFLKNNDRISKYLYLGTMTINTIISLMLLIYVQRHR